jgi:hypothetical protein
MWHPGSRLIQVVIQAVETLASLIVGRIINLNPEFGMLFRLRKLRPSYAIVSVMLTMIGHISISRQHSGRPSNTQQETLKTHYCAIKDILIKEFAANLFDMVFATTFLSSTTASMMTNLAFADAISAFLADWRSLDDCLQSLHDESDGNSKEEQTVRRDGGKPLPWIDPIFAVLSVIGVFVANLAISRSRCHLLPPVLRSRLNGNISYRQSQLEVYS